MEGCFLVSKLLVLLMSFALPLLWCQSNPPMHKVLFKRVRVDISVWEANVKFDSSVQVRYSYRP